jgi:hypothetical protein
VERPARPVVLIDMEGRPPEVRARLVAIDPGRIDSVAPAVLEVCAGGAGEGVKSDMVMHGYFSL